MTQSGRPRYLKSKRAVVLDRPPLTFRLVASVIPDHLINLSLYSLKIETGRCLHRRKVDGRFRKLCHLLLHGDETPELTGIEVIHVSATEIVQRLGID